MSAHSPLVRAAVQLQRVYQGLAAQAAERELAAHLDSFPKTLEHARAALRQAVLQGQVCIPALQHRLLPLMTAVRAGVRHTCRALTGGERCVPDLRSLLADLHELEGEFGGLDIELRARLVCVTTEPIELEDVYLGPFAIRLCWTRLQQQPGHQNFEIEALEPNPAASDDTVTHPHVRRGVLCAGSAALPIRRALEQGRLGDAFCLVRSVLTTYNSGSPHVSLDDWSGSHCSACDAAVDRDELSSCERCGGSYCEECVAACASCDRTCCWECLDRCDVCDQWHCRRCLQPAGQSAKSYCPGCLHSCTACGNKVPRDEMDPACQLCSACVTGHQGPSWPTETLVPLPDPSLTEQQHECAPSAAVTL